MFIFSLIVALLAKILHPTLSVGSSDSFPPILSAEEEAALFKKMLLGDDSAREKIILHNLRLVSHIVRKYYSSSKNSEDLVSIGTIGLIKAVDSFKCDVGARFATYAAKCIQNEILMSFRAQKKRANEISIHETIDVDRDGNPLTYIDVISSDDSMTSDIERKLSASKAKKLVNTLLTPRERHIITLRYGLSGKEPMTQREIAEKLKISRSYVSRIEKSALEKLRSALK